MSEVLDTLGAALVLVGSFFCLAAALGVLRFPDVLTRLHAATKTQVFGLVLALSGVAVTVRTWDVLVLSGLIIVLQILSSPVSGHMLGRAAYRTGEWDHEDAVVDELGADLEDAGFVHAAEDGPDGHYPRGFSGWRSTS